MKDNVFTSLTVVIQAAHRIKTTKKTPTFTKTFEGVMGIFLERWE